MRYVTINVAPFSECPGDKAAALKVVEEAAEVFAAWQDMQRAIDPCLHESVVMDECADVIQAAVNLMRCYGDGWDIQEAMQYCTERNVMRGRIREEDE